MKQLLLMVVSFIFLASFVVSQRWAYATPALVDTTWLAKHQANDSPLDLYIIEVFARESDDKQHTHIPQAIKTIYQTDGWVNNNTNLKGLLPNFETLANVAANLGISQKKHIVLVAMHDNAHTLAATLRIYWVLRMLGMTNLSVLDGGFYAYQQAGLPTRRRAIQPIRKLFDANIQANFVAYTKDVQQAINHYTPLIDLRLADFYHGVDKHAFANFSGSISGADNIPWSTLLDKHHHFLPLAQLRKTFAPALLSTENEPVIVFSETGHIAVIGWFVLSELLGRKSVQLYDDGYLYWQSLPNARLQNTDESLGQLYGLIYAPNEDGCQ
ncbi:MAG: sulfurtransferase [bacterium]